MLQRTKHFVVTSVGGTTRFANLQRKFSRTKKSARVMPNTSYGTVEILINSTRIMGIRVTISCRYSIAFEVMLLFLVFY